MTAYEAGKLRGSINDACERAKAKHEGRQFARDWIKQLDVEAALDLWYLTPEGADYKAQCDEIVRLETVILIGDPTEEEIAAYRLQKATPPFSEFDRGELEVTDAVCHEFVEWLCQKEDTPR
jgi:hypothetical protein